MSNSLKLPFSAKQIHRHPLLSLTSRALSLPSTTKQSPCQTTAIVKRQPPLLHPEVDQTPCSIILSKECMINTSGMPHNALGRIYLSWLKSLS
ncbi:unnamed protein product [Ilex paraguariensis]|uniref:Uncharacterized protein n=1 Tax=Ilex paraguariensis TaxID=185542 RepID=A0ABC8QX06_9AQUA